MLRNSIYQYNRSALPQHFDTVDGHHEGGKKCSLKQMQSTHPNNNTTAHGQYEAIQKYNKAANHGFATFCDNNHANEHQRQLQQEKSSSCTNNNFEHTCTVNRTNMEYRTVYRFLVENNCTKQLNKRYFTGNNDSNSSTTLRGGKILRWNIDNLFDHPQWHVGDTDCSHFCYIPPMYEAAFERLDMLLPELE